MYKRTEIITAVIILVIGVGVGYALGSNTSPFQGAGSNTMSGMHMMPDGTMMSNKSGTMSMSAMMASMNAELAGKTGDEFDKAFLSEMIVHHQGAVEMAELALTNARHQEIKELAETIISAQNKEISDMQSWQKSWYRMSQ